jgi:hypothetical protein
VTDHTACSSGYMQVLHSGPTGIEKGGQRIRHWTNYTQRLVPLAMKAAIVAPVGVYHSHSHRRSKTSLPCLAGSTSSPTSRFLASCPSSGVLTSGLSSLRDPGWRVKELRSETAPSFVEFLAPETVVVWNSFRGHGRRSLPPNHDDI